MVKKRGTKIFGGETMLDIRSVFWIFIVFAFNYVGYHNGYQDAKKKCRDAWNKWGEYPDV